ncbi:MAG: ATPase, T2SS/T4P/T4SS family [Erysipelotrichaceae bacterium]
MEALFLELLTLALSHYASDIHFVVKDQHLKLSIRGLKGIILIDKEYPVGLLNYLKFIAHLELGQTHLPQNGNFQRLVDDKVMFFRLAVLKSLEQETAVLRILNQTELSLEHLSGDEEVLRCFRRWARLKSGLVLFSGPTGCGKTTTLNTILTYIATELKQKVITIEDPIEIHNPYFVQLQVQDKMAFTYANGIREVLRHDPDVIMIGEIRDEESARQTIRAALSGHLVFSTVHAHDCLQVIHRMKDLGVSTPDLQQTLVGVVSQRLFTRARRKERICLYELLTKEQLQRALAQLPLHDSFASLQTKAKVALDQGLITKSEWNRYFPH